MTGEIGNCIDRYELTSQTDTERELAKNARTELAAYDKKIDALVALRKRISDVQRVDQEAGQGHTNGIRDALKALDKESDEAFVLKNQRINAFASRMRWLQLALVLVASIIGIALSSLIIKGILKSVNEVKLVTEKAATGDLSNVITVHTDDEIGEMAQGFNHMITKLRGIIGEINTSTGSLASSSEELSSTADDMSKGSHESFCPDRQVVTAMTEVSQTIMDMARNASSAADGSKDASETAVQRRTQFLLWNWQSSRR